MPIPAHVCSGVQRVQEMALGPLEVWAAVSCPLWVLRTELGPLEEQVTAKPWTLKLAASETESRHIPRGVTKALTLVSLPGF